MYLNPNSKRICVCNYQYNLLFCIHIFIEVLVELMFSEFLLDIVYFCWLSFSNEMRQDKPSLLCKHSLHRADVGVNDSFPRSNPHVTIKMQFIKASIRIANIRYLNWKLVH